MKLYVYLLFTLGFASYTSAGWFSLSIFEEYKGPILLDPLIPEKCNEKDQDYKKIANEVNTCIRTENNKYGLDLKPGEARTKYGRETQSNCADQQFHVGEDLWTSCNDFEISRAFGLKPFQCRSQEGVLNCLKPYVQAVRPCYDDEADKEALTTIIDIYNASMSYWCENNGERLEAFNNALGKIREYCLTQRVMMNSVVKDNACSERVKKLLTPPVPRDTNMFRDDEDMCQTSFESENCEVNAYKSCYAVKSDRGNPPEAPIVYNLAKGEAKAALLASRCGKYVNTLAKGHNYVTDEDAPVPEPPSTDAGHGPAPSFIGLLLLVILARLS